MKFSTFILLDRDTKLSKIRSTVDQCQYNVTGSIIYPFDTPLPIIVSGKGCIGIGIVSGLSMTSTSTTVYFSVSEINDSEAKAYYNLYRNTVTTTGVTDDPYEDSYDSIIPGAMGTKTQVNPKPASRYRRSYESLTDYLDD